MDRRPWKETHAAARAAAVGPSGWQGTHTRRVVGRVHHLALRPSGRSVFDLSLSRRPGTSKAEGGGEKTKTRKQKTEGGPGARLATHRPAYSRQRRPASPEVLAQVTAKSRPHPMALRLSAVTVSPLTTPPWARPPPPPPCAGRSSRTPRCRWSRVRATHATRTYAAGQGAAVCVRV